MGEGHMQTNNNPLGIKTNIQKNILGLSEVHKEVGAITGLQSAINGIPREDSIAGMRAITNLEAQVAVADHKIALEEEKIEKMAEERLEVDEMEI